MNLELDGYFARCEQLVSWARPLSAPLLSPFGEGVERGLARETSEQLAFSAFMNTSIFFLVIYRKWAYLLYVLYFELLRSQSGALKKAAT